MSPRSVKIGSRTRANDSQRPARTRTITSSAPNGTDAWPTTTVSWQGNFGGSQTNPDAVRWAPTTAMVWWSRLVSNQRPSACEADALPLSYETEGGAHQKVSIRRPGTLARQGHPPGMRSSRHVNSGDLCGFACVDYCRASQRATISFEACGCSAVGSASPCQGEGRGFESRHPLEGASAASDPTVEWPSGEATACKAVHTGSIPVSTSKRFIPRD